MQFGIKPDVSMSWCALPDALMMDINQEPIVIEIKIAFNSKNLTLEDLYKE